MENKKKLFVIFAVLASFMLVFTGCGPADQPAEDVPGDEGPVGDEPVDEDPMEEPAEGDIPDGAEPVPVE